MKAFVGSLVRDRHACDDLMQEIALILWREFPRYDPTRPFGAWARGIAARKLMQRADQIHRTPVPFVPEAIQAVLEACDRRERAASPQADALEECLKRLPEKSRRLLALRYEDAHGLGQIAQEVNSTLEAVHKALVRIRLRLRECVRQRVADLEGGVP